VRAVDSRMRGRPVHRFMGIARRRAGPGVVRWRWSSIGIQLRVKQTGIPRSGENRGSSLRPMRRTALAAPFCRLIHAKHGIGYRPTAEAIRLAARATHG
jgi:hypothetical protein